LTLVASQDVLKLQSKQRPRKKYHLQPHELLERGRNVVVALDPLIVDVLDLVPGQYICRQELDGVNVVMRFEKKEGFQT
jgi:hypothetical protein